MKRKAAFFVAFEKVEKQDDGTMLVSGVASSEAVDADGEIITSDAMKAALPDYMKFGAIREMHQPIAAGSAIKCEVDAAGVTHLEAKIVDPTTVMKIEEEVLKGFSVGGKVTSRDPLNKTIITGIRLTEISVVDRPANPEAVFKLAKVEGDETEPTVGELRKCMGNVLDFADIINRIGWLGQSVAWEAEYEGDNSPVPAALRDWLADGAGIFQAMAAEEIAELLATLPVPPTMEVIQMAEKLSKGELAEDLAKVGKKFSKAVAESLGDIHKMIQDCDTKLAALGYNDDKQDDDEADGKEDDKEDADKVAKAAKQSDDLQKALGQVETLTKRVKELEAQPAPPKGVLNANSVVAKTDDHSNPDSNDAALMKQAEEIAKLPPEEQTRLLIKAIHAGSVVTR
jgi:hypothetical protein